jgi:hypothetical protein
MNPILILGLLGGGAMLLLGGKKKSSPPSTTKPSTAKPSTVKINTPAGPVAITVPPTAGPEVPPVLIPPVKVSLPTLPTAEDYPTKPASGNLDPMLDQSEQYSLGNYSNDQLYREGMTSGHLAYVAAIATKLASSGDTRAMDLTLRVANWGK